MYNLIESAYLKLRKFIFGLISPKNLFADPNHCRPLKFKTVLDRIKTKVKPVSDREWRLICAYRQEVRTTRYFLHNRFAAAKPSLIYHHQAGANHYRLSMNLLLGQKILNHFNIFSIKAQAHSSLKDYLSNFADSFIHQQQAFAGSVLAVEEIVKFHRYHSSQPVFVVGISMGGIVASLHAYFFNSADKYFPLVAYPNVGEIFLGKSYQYCVEDWSRKQSNRQYFDSYRLNLKDKPELKNKVFPVLGEKDTIVSYDKAAEFWQGFKVLSFPYGHFTPAAERKAIQSLIYQSF